MAKLRKARVCQAHNGDPVLSSDMWVSRGRYVQRKVLQTKIDPDGKYLHPAARKVGEA